MSKIYGWKKGAKQWLPQGVELGVAAKEILVLGS